MYVLQLVVMAWTYNYSSGFWWYPATLLTGCCADSRSIQ